MPGILKNIAYQIISPKSSARAYYKSFRKLLKNDQLAHEYLAELQEIQQQPFQRDFSYINNLYKKLAQSVSSMIGCLKQLSPKAATHLQGCYEKIDFSCRFALTCPEIISTPPFLLPLKAGYVDDCLIGGKAFHLAQLAMELNMPVPDGFVISTSTYNYFLDYNKLRPQINSLLQQLNILSPTSLQSTSDSLTKLILESTIPEAINEVLNEIINAIQEQSNSSHIVLRSSAVSEDSVISFAGQYHSVLRVNRCNIQTAYKKVLASRFSSRALYYRISHGYFDETTAMAVLALPMIEAVTSGVITTLNPTSANLNSMTIHYVPGLGDKLVGGLRSPTTLVVKGEKGNISIEFKPDPHSAGGEREDLKKLSQHHILQLTEQCSEISSFYGSPQEIEWCINQQGKIVILQSRSLFIQPTEKALPTLGCSEFPTLLAGGETAARGVACGRVFHLKDMGDLQNVPDRAMLVTATTSPSLLTISNRLAGVIAKQGSVADHFASVARENGLPVLVKVGNKVDSLPDGLESTLWADERRLYKGKVETLLTENPLNEKVDQQSSCRQALNLLINYISPLQLIDPASQNFTASNCRSFHDIIRFCHEKGLQAMFGVADKKPVRKGGALLLRADLPLQLYLLDVDDGFSTTRKKRKEVTIKDVRCQPLLALWKGLSHRNIKWQGRNHFDWKAYDKQAMTGSFVSPKSVVFASYGLISSVYLNLNMRFGYHFAILDTMCGDHQSENYIHLRFAGGGGDMDGKVYRLLMIKKLLVHFGFIVKSRGDLIEGRLAGYNQISIMETLEMCGRFLGATRLMDMMLSSEEMALQAVDEFLEGRYNFSNE